MRNSLTLCRLRMGCCVKVIRLGADLRIGRRPVPSVRFRLGETRAVAFFLDFRFGVLGAATTTLTPTSSRHMALSRMKFRVGWIRDFILGSFCDTISLVVLVVVTRKRKGVGRGTKIYGETNSVFVFSKVTLLYESCFNRGSVENYDRTNCNYGIQLYQWSFAGFLLKKF